MIGLSFHRALVSILLLFATGCSTTRKAPSEPSKPQLIGTVMMVNPVQKFALINLESGYSPNAGKALKCFSGDIESGILSVSPEKKRSFIIADIVSGAPVKGDKVYE